MRPTSTQPVSPAEGARDFASLLGDDRAPPCRDQREGQDRPRGLSDADADDVQPRDARPRVAVVRQEGEPEEARCAEDKGQREREGLRVR